jgi:hypothetical protein
LPAPSVNTEKIGGNTLDDGFKVNDFDHLEDAKQPGLEYRRESNGWGLVREDLTKHGVHMLANVTLTWDESTPPEMRKVFAEAAMVLHQIAERAIMAQLRHDGLLPFEIRDVLHGTTNERGTVVLHDSGWKPT